MNTTLEFVSNSKTQRHASSYSRRCRRKRTAARLFLLALPLAVSLSWFVYAAAKLAAVM